MELLINLNNIVAMKKIVLLFVSLASLMISCSTDEDLAFSCDPIVDQWVKANYNELQTISRQDFISLPDESYQRATYASFSPQKQMKLWETKINEAIEGICNANFKINPKIIKGKNVSCSYCKYKDICYHEYKDNVIISGGEEDE